MRWTVACAAVLVSAVASGSYAADRGHNNNNQVQQHRDDDRKKNNQNNRGNQNDQVQNPNAPNSNANGTPKINDGVSGGNSNTGQTQRAVPGTNPNATSANANANTGAKTDLPAQPGGILGGKGNASVEPGSDGKLVTPGDFSRDKQIRDLTDSKGPLNEFGPRGGNAITDRANANPADALNAATATPGRGAGKNATDKQSEQGMFANTQMVVPGASSAPAPGQGPIPIPYPNIGMGASPAGPTFTVTPAHNLDATVKPSNGDNAGSTAGTASSTVMGSTRTTTSGSGGSVDGSPVTRMTVAPAKPDSGGAPAPTPSQPKVLLLGGTPDPEKDGGDGKGVPAGVKQLGAPTKTPAQVEAERKRQAGLPNDTGGPPDRMRMENAAKENVSARQSNLINPQRGDGTTSNLGVGVAPPPQGTGNNPTGGKAGGGPNSGNPGGSKPDDPSASNACGAGNNC